MKRIPLTQGKYAIVDDEDFEWLSKYKWQASKTSYGGYRADRNTHQPQGKIRMHRQIMDAPKGMDVDHINRNTLDNRKCNLRICTRNQNFQNRLSYRGSSSAYKGVCWIKRNRKWRAYITVNFKRIYLGFFDDDKQAAKAYDRAAIKYFGEFANVNFKESKNEYQANQIKGRELQGVAVL